MDRKITDAELRRRLEACGFDPGPLTEFSRAYWTRKLTEAERSGRGKSPSPRQSARRHPVRQGLIYPDDDDDERLANQGEDTGVSSDLSDSSDDEGFSSAAKRRETEIQQRKSAVAKVQKAGARVLEDVRKAHLKSRRPPFMLQYGLHTVVAVLLAIAAVMLLHAVNDDRTRRSAGAQDNFVWCVRGQYCSKDSEKRIDRALQLAYHLARASDEKAGNAECSENGGDRDMKPETLKEISRALHHEHSIDAQLALRDASQLFLANSHWKVALVSAQFITVEPRSQLTLDAVRTVHLVSTNPRRPLACRVRRAVHSAATQALLFSMLCFLLVAAFVAVRLYMQRREDERQRVFAMVDGILRHLRRVHQASLAPGSSASAAVPISHVRDALLAPAHRQSRAAVWSAAVAWINRSESRVRTETRRISGEDFVVWRWIPIASYADVTDGGAPLSTTTSPAASSPSGRSSAAENLERREKQWGGHVLEHYSGESFRQQILPLAEEPSRCIKLRNLYPAQPRPSGVEFEELEAGVLHKLTQYGGVLHCFLDRWTDEGALYAKLDSADAATSVIAALHGTWYNSRLVKAEYVPLPEYHRLFPSSKYASKLMFPP